MLNSDDGQLERLQRLDHDTLIRVESKMDSLTTEMRQTNAVALSTTSDHEARIRVLEVDRDRNSGSQYGSDKVKNTLFAIIGICVGIITAYATYIATITK